MLTRFLAWCEASLGEKWVRYVVLDPGADKPTSAVGSTTDACSPSVASGESAALVTWERKDLSELAAVPVS